MSWSSRTDLQSTFFGGNFRGFNFHFTILFHFQSDIKMVITIKTHKQQFGLLHRQFSPCFFFFNTYIFCWSGYFQIRFNVRFPLPAMVLVPSAKRHTPIKSTCFLLFFFVQSVYFILFFCGLFLYVNILNASTVVRAVNDLCCSRLPLLLPLQY